MNRLADSTSPYLRSHADNPVAWFPWGEAAFAEARRRDVPVLVSIGYSTCHWCHVMARESFSDPVVAEYLNDNLVAIKVDREEYPDVDASFLAAAGAFTQNLGWPLNVFVTPDGGPFFAGTYWPPEPLGGHPSFRTVLGAVIDAWTNNRDAVRASASDITAAIGAASIASDGDLPTDLSDAVARIAALEDPEFGGIGRAPKFPVAPVLDFLIGHDRSLATRLLSATRALHDTDGGFFRYATQRDWSEPHFERMLYDNALLLGSYARVGDRETATGIAHYLIGTMRLPSGAFASAQDSESAVDGIRGEGTYFVLSMQDRASQPPPALDEKVLTGWNGLAIGALALAGRLLGGQSWITAAVDAADFLLDHHAWPLIRTSIAGTPSPAPATLEDFGMLAGGLIELALATGEVRFAVAARTLVDACGTDFVVPGGAEPVLASLGLAMPSDPSEGAYPSGISALADAAMRLWLLSGDRSYRDRAERAMRAVAPLALANPTSFGSALGVIAALAAEATQVVVVADEQNALTAEARTYDGLAVVVTSEQAIAWAASGFALFEGRTAIGARPTAFACREFVCDLPVFDEEALRRALN
jgi:uncharacterized protein